MDCFESLAQTPEGDCELREAKQRLGQRLCLAGGIDQKSFLVQATPQEVRQTVKETLAVMKDGGRYILSTVDYLAEDTPLENVLAFVEAGRDFGAF
jgi:uroporphyrinogen decarboxylase